MDKLAITTLLFLTALLVPACASAPSLTMTGTRELVYEEVRSVELANKDYSVGMVIPPLASDLSELTAVAATAEAAMLKSGIRPVSSAYAAGFRAAAKTIDSAGGAQLLKETLASVKESGAEFVVVISQMEWSTDERPTRLFVSDGDSAFREVEPAEFGPWQGPKFSFTSPVLSFTGKVMDVASTETIATFEIEAPANWSMPSDYLATMESDGERWVVRSESFDYAGNQWLPAAKEATEDRVIAHAVSLVRSPRPGAEAPDSADADATAPGSETPPK